jgi:pimeloyl-ACP methyl ester carboxylesterase
VARALDLDLDGGRLRAYDAGPEDGFPVFWHHGTPNLGPPPEPLYRDGVRWLGFDRPGYGGSADRPGRDVAAMAGLVAQIADALSLDRFGVMGHSGGGAPALACGALLSGRVIGVVSVSSPAPYRADELDWFAGMHRVVREELGAAVRGREALAALLERDEFDPEMFDPSDHAALAGAWSWLNSVVGPALANGPGGMIDDDLATVSDWGFDPTEVRAPTLVLHGERDRMIPVAHGRWLASRVPGAELRLAPEKGHVSILEEAGKALDWLLDRRP